MYGPHAISETKLACQGMEAIPSNSIVMGDAGFGKFSVAYEAVQCDQDYLFRMKKSDFDSLTKTAELVSESVHHKTYRHTWIPTKNNRETNPELPPRHSLEVHLHEVAVTEKLTLYLVTSLSHDAWTLSDLFERRYDVEIDIRNFKVVLDAENIGGKERRYLH